MLLDATEKKTYLHRLILTVNWGGGELCTFRRTLNKDANTSY